MLDKKSRKQRSNKVSGVVRDTKGIRCRAVVKELIIGTSSGL